MAYLLEQLGSRSTVLASEQFEDARNNLLLILILIQELSNLEERTKDPCTSIPILKCCDQVREDGVSADVSGIVVQVVVQIEEESSLLPMLLHLYLLQEQHGIDETVLHKRVVS